MGRQTNADCESSDPADTVTDRLNTLLNSTGPGYVLQLCPGSRYLIKAPISFAFPGQEISTLGYPVGDERATLVVSGPTTNGQGHTIAVDGTCANCSGVKLRHVQVVFAISPFVSALSETFYSVHRSMEIAVEVLLRRVELILKWEDPILIRSSNL